MKSARSGRAVGTIILAAGASTRLGKPKQLLTYRGQTFLERVTMVALSLDAGPIAAVLGASADAIRPVLNRLPVFAVENPTWSEGIASSLRVGLAALLAVEPKLKAVLILLCDQPLVEREALGAFIQQWQATGRPIIAAKYGETTGVPALFDARFFPELLELRGDTGARHLIRKHAGECLGVALPEASLDVDTASDFAELAALPPDAER
jgi:molybdenum cofactor cytidylyltransferase